MGTPVLLPYPQKISFPGGEVNLTDNQIIALGVSSPPNLLPVALMAQKALSQYAQVKWPISGGTSGPDEQLGLLISNNNSDLRAQEYHLSVNTGRIHINAGDEAGVFYAVQTLVQLLKQYGNKLPLLEIDDWPDLKTRGVLLDISRNKVPSMKTIFNIVDMLASWKINQLQLYTEHTFAYQNHPQVWANASPITAEEVLTLDVYCRERFIDLVPNQNCFGHMTRWFAHNKYRPLAETKGGFTHSNSDSPWGRLDIEFPSPYSLSPSNPGSLELVDSLFAELLPNFSSDLFNVNCDETFDLGLGKSRAICKEKGSGRVYLEFLLEIYERVLTHGRRMQFWGDIIGNHPDLISEIPRDVIALEWGYEANHPFGAKCQAFADNGIPFYVCPGTSSWNSLAGRVDNAIENISSAVKHGIKYGAEGMLVTDWGDNGHWQQLPISYPGFVFAAGTSWAYANNIEMDLPTILDKFAFEDQAGILGQSIVDLGNMYQLPGLLIPNNSVLFWGYRIPLDRVGDPNIRETIAAWSGDRGNFIEHLHETVAMIDEITSTIDNSNSSLSDAKLVVDETHFTTRMLNHAAVRLLTLCGVDSKSRPTLETQQYDILTSFRQIWLKRNRPGGLEDSIMYMTGQLSPPDMPTWESILKLYSQSTQSN